jgi:hypothetical protein
MSPNFTHTATQAHRAEQQRRAAEINRFRGIRKARVR